MTISRKVKEEIKLFQGQKSALPIGTLRATDAISIKNYVIRKGKLRKIWGTVKYAEPVLGGSGPTLWLDRYEHRWLQQQGSVIGIESADGSKIFNSLISGLSTVASDNLGNLINLRVRSEKWRNNIYTANGKEFKFYDGANVLNVGIIPPGNGFEDAFQPDISLSQSNSSGTLVDTTVYQYLVTWYDSNRNIESLPNGAVVQEDGLWFGRNVAEITIAAPSDTVTIDVTNVKADGYDVDRVTHFIVYRALVTAGVAGDFRRISNSDGIFSIATNSVTDGDPSEATRGSVLNEENSAPPNGSKYLILAGLNTQGGGIGFRFIKQFRDQLWGFGTQFPGNDIPYQPVKSILYGSAVQNFDYYPYAFDVERSNQEEDSGLAEFKNTLIVLKSRSIHYLDGTNPDNYVIRKLDGSRGCIAPGSIQETPKGVVAMSADGFILINGAGPAELISDPIFDEFQDINFDRLDKVVSGYDPKEGKYECHVPMTPSENTTKVFVYDINENTWQFHQGREGQALKYDLDSKNRRIGLLGDGFNSSLYDVTDEDSVTVNGKTILSRYATNHFDFGYPELQKRLVFLKLKARSKTDFKISIDIIQDFGQQETITIADIESESAYSTWAADANDESGMTWDEDAWAGKFIDRKIEVLLSGVARNFQIVIRESENSADRAQFEIEEIILEANLLGR